jgi:formimidoylglutamate deiminase
MQSLWAETALVGENWQNNVRVDIADGKINAITAGADPIGTRVGLLCPAPANGHSHAFQRAMAGLTEKRGELPSDSFWTWRKLMFQFLDQLTPDQVQAITAFVQMEMLEAGFGASVEFHYLHHQPGGIAYDKLGEMSDRVIAAAETSGMGLTLLPVLYRFGGCDQRPLGDGQIRFGNAPDAYARLIDEARSSISALPDGLVGVAPHSLRAVAREDFAMLGELAQGAPIHMHLAEQIPEVDEVQAAWGARPVEWALDNLDMSGQWSLIHCTQMLPHETEGLAKSGAVAGLCPLTEASLGDGIFDGMRWAENAGRIAIGSDSNIRISLAEELRQLDTSQRLRDHSRAAYATAELSTGHRLMLDACAGGAQVAGRGTGRIEVGQTADLMALDSAHVDLMGLQGDTALDSFVFAGGNDMVRDVWSGGRHLVQDGHHIRRDAIVADYAKAVKTLREGL